MTNEPLTIHSDLLDCSIEVTTAGRGTTDGLPAGTWKAVELAFEGAGGWRPDAALDALINTGCAAIPDDMEPVVIIDGRMYGLDVRLAYIAERLIIDHEHPPTESRVEHGLDDNMFDVTVTRRGPVVSMAADLSCLRRYTIPTPSVAESQAARYIMRMIGEQITRDHAWSLPVGIDVTWTSTSSTSRSGPTDVSFRVAPAASGTGSDVTCRTCAPDHRHLAGLVRPNVMIEEALTVTATHIYAMHSQMIFVEGGAPSLAVRVTFIAGDDS